MDLDQDLETSLHYFLFDDIIKYNKGNTLFNSIIGFDKLGKELVPNDENRALIDHWVKESGKIIKDLEHTAKLFEDKKSSKKQITMAEIFYEEDYLEIIISSIQDGIYDSGIKYRTT